MLHYYITPWLKGKQACEGPYNYIDSLQGKKFHNKLVDALNTWLPVEPESLEITKRIVQGLHNSSLM